MQTQTLQCFLFSYNSIRGFCFFNNVAIAAQISIQKYKLKKVLIFDWDIHHGNGTEEIFYENDQVLFISIHSYGKFYPGSGESKNIGKNKGEGFNINVPLEGDGYGDEEYLLILEKIVIPVLKEFYPEIILISAGFDAVKGDLLGKNCNRFY
jgi:histone deacetylase 6